MAGLRGYPQPGYKPAARDFQQSPPLSPKRASPVSAGDPVDAQLLQEIISGTAYSRKEQLLLEVIEVAAKNIEREAPIAARVLRVPGRFMPWLNAFMIGYDVTSAALDAYEWWTSSQKNINNTSADGYPSAPTATSYVAHTTYADIVPFTPGDNPTAFTFLSPDQLYLIDGSFGAGPYVHETYWYWPFGTPPYSYYTTVIVGDTAPAGVSLDSVIKTLGLPVAPQPPRIPYNLIPYINPAPEPEAKPQPAPAGWFMTNGPTPPDTTGYRDTPGRERKKQLTGKGAAAMRIVKALMNAATETCDAVEALYEAIPESARIGYGFQYEKRIYKRAVSTVPGTKGKIIRDASGSPVVEKSYLSRISCTRMAKILAQRTADRLEIVDLIDWDKAINNLIVNQIEDAVFGFAGSKANDAYVNRPGYNSPFGLGLGKVF